VVIQKRWRGILARKFCKQYKDAMENSARIIQRARKKSYKAKIQNNDKSTTKNKIPVENKLDHSIDKPTAMKAIDDMVEYFKNLKLKKFPDQSHVLKNLLNKQNELNLKKQEEKIIEKATGKDTDVVLMSGKLSLGVINIHKILNSCI
jgi:isochorismate hydrolase